MRLALVTGDVGSGKTTVVGRVVALARARGYACAGLWAPAHVVGGKKVGIEVVDLAGGERRLLASVTAEKTGQRMGRYAFDPAVLAWANEVLAKAVAARPELLVVDEVGPLELERGGGLAPVLEPLAAGRVPHALVVVRAWLLDALRTRLSDVPAKAFTVNGATREQVPQRITDWLFETSTPPA
jgi:nucleoside-triphosphatase